MRPDPVPIPTSEVEDEATSLRKLLDAGEGNQDMLYAAYNALLFALGYGVKRPSESFNFELDEQTPGA